MNIVKTHKLKRKIRKPYLITLLTGKGLTSLWADAVRGRGVLKGVELVSKMVKYMNSINSIKVLLVGNTYTYSLKQQNSFFFKFDISIMFSCSVLTSLS